MDHPWNFSQISDALSADNAILVTRESVQGEGLGQGSGENGRLDLAADIDSLPSLYTSGRTLLTSVGEFHWGLRLSGLGLRSATDDTGALPPPPCSDQHAACRDWQTAGECEHNPTFMREQCQQSCGSCAASDRATAYTCSSRKLPQPRDTKTNAQRFGQRTR